MSVIAGRNGAPRGRTGAGVEDDAERLRALSDRIEAAKRAADPAPEGESHHSLANTAWRMVVELVAGLAIGFGIGYGLDTLLGTMPLFLIVFILFGLAAGIKVMMRTAAEIGARAARGDRPGSEGD